MYFRKRLDVQLVYSWCFLVSMCHLVVNFVKLLLLFFFLCDIRANQPNDRPSVCLFICPFEIYFSFLSLFYIVEFFSVFYFILLYGATFKQNVSVIFVFQLSSGQSVHEFILFSFIYFLYFSSCLKQKQICYNITQKKTISFIILLILLVFY